MIKAVARQGLVRTVLLSAGGILVTPGAWADTGQSTTAYWAEEGRNALARALAVVPNTATCCLDLPDECMHL